MHKKDALVAISFSFPIVAVTTQTFAINFFFVFFVLGFVLVHWCCHPQYFRATLMVESFKLLYFQSYTDRLKWQNHDIKSSQYSIEFIAVQFTSRQMNA